jgi:hypothetical protein
MDMQSKINQPNKYKIDTGTGMRQQQSRNRTSSTILSHIIQKTTIKRAIFGAPPDDSPHLKTEKRRDPVNTNNRFVLGWIKPS